MTRDIEEPNQATVDAMEEARAGGLVSHETVDALLEDLNKVD